MATRCAKSSACAKKSPAKKSPPSKNHAALAIPPSWWPLLKKRFETWAGNRSIRSLRTSSLPPGPGIKNIRLGILTDAAGFTFLSERSRIRVGATMEQPLDNLKILLVDDDPLILKIYRDGLARQGLRVETAGDGLAAVQSLRAAKPDWVVLDLMMPKF